MKNLFSFPHFDVVLIGGSATDCRLAKVKHILEAHKSVIYVQSQPGQGTTISFTLKK